MLAAVAGPKAREQTDAFAVSAIVLNHSVWDACGLVEVCRVASIFVWYLSVPSSVRVGYGFDPVKTTPKKKITSKQFLVVLCYRLLAYAESYWRYSLGRRFLFLLDWMQFSCLYSMSISFVVPQQSNCPYSNFNNQHIIEQQHVVIGGECAYEIHPGSHPGSISRPGIWAGLK